ncbi:hypothetical protein ACFLXG_03235 [Chloroflexota bacterium]
MKRVKYIILGIIITTLILGIYQGSLICNQTRELKEETTTMLNSLEGITTSTDESQRLTAFDMKDQNLNDFFVGVLNKEKESLKADINEVWDADGLTCPGDQSHLLLTSKAHFLYPVLGINHIFPTFTELGKNALSVGICIDTATDLWKCELSEYDSAFRLLAGTDPVVRNLEITDLMPVDFATNPRNEYHMKLEQNRVSLFINAKLKAVILFGIQEDIPIYSNTEPYAIGSVPSQIPFVRQPLYINLSSFEGGFDTIWDIPAPNTGEWRMAFSEGQPSGPLMLPVYIEKTTTKWTELSTSGTLLVSHPVPIWGYQNKTLFFQADKAGTLTIQIYVGGDWRTIDTPRVMANILLQYDLTIEAPIARCIYEPESNDIIAAAEWGFR